MFFFCWFSFPPRVLNKTFLRSMFLRRGADGEDAFASARFSGLYPSCGLRRVWSANRGESPFQQVGPMGDEIIKDGGGKKHLRNFLGGNNASIGWNLIHG